MKNKWTESRYEPNVIVDEKFEHVVATCTDAENTARILTACNSHDELVEALGDLESQAKYMNNMQHAGIKILPMDWSRLHNLGNIAAAVLAKVRGES
jgi:hypothetical protein